MTGIKSELEWLMWDESGRPYVGTFRGGVRVRLRDATAGDRAAMYDGRLRYDRETDPTTAAWDRLADQGL